MAEWANIYLIVKGKGGITFIEEIKRLAKETTVNYKGFKPFEMGEDYWHNIWTDDKELVNYETKYVDNATDVLAMARKFNFSFHLGSEEHCFSHYAEYRYNYLTDIFEGRILAETLIEEIKPHPKGYIFRNQIWESWSVVCEKLIKKEKWKSEEIILKSLK